MDEHLTSGYVVKYMVDELRYNILKRRNYLKNCWLMGFSTKDTCINYGDGYVEFGHKTGALMLFKDELTKNYYIRSEGIE